MSNNNYNQTNSLEMDAVNIYIKVITGELKIFPMGFSCSDDSIERAIQITRWLIEKKLNWSEEELKIKFTLNTFKENHLYGMLVACFKSSPYSALEHIYPNKFKAWELRSVPNNY